MSDLHSMFVNPSERDHIALLHEICSIAKVGAASTDADPGFKFLKEAHGNLFEVIHRFASEAVIIAERKDGEARCQS